MEIDRQEDNIKIEDTESDSYSSIDIEKLFERNKNNSRQKVLNFKKKYLLILFILV